MPLSSVRDSGCFQSHGGYTDGERPSVAPAIPGFRGTWPSMAVVSGGGRRDGGPLLSGRSVRPPKLDGRRGFETRRPCRRQAGKGDVHLVFTSDFNFRVCEF